MSQIRGISFGERIRGRTRNWVIAIELVFEFSV